MPSILRIPCSVVCLRTAHTRYTRSNKDIVIPSLLTQYATAFAYKRENNLFMVFYITVLCPKNKVG